MKLTDKQFQALAPFKDKFRTAIEGCWVSAPSPDALKQLAEIQRQLTGAQRAVRIHCSSCVLHMMQFLGKCYMADEAERLATKKNANGKGKKNKHKQTGI